LQKGEVVSVDVLIVGAGPTGLMLANQLWQRGVRTLVIDRHSCPAQQTRAMAVHARTLEIYSKLGIAGPVLFLLRPDGHIGLAGTQLAAPAIMGYFSQFGIRPTLVDAGGLTPRRGYANAN
jgi:2-polyprenyl-6-methoxyphenol hydroxylase-like FAD-dependent oxidoreductase